MAPLRLSSSTASTLRKVPSWQSEYYFGKLLLASESWCFGYGCVSKWCFFSCRKQVSVLFNSFGASFLWSFFQWFFAAGDDCGFKVFPTFGLKAYQNKWVEVTITSNYFCTFYVHVCMHVYVHRSLHIWMCIISMLFIFINRERLSHAHF